MSLQDLLLPALSASDVVAGWEVLRDLEGKERQEAARWFASHQRWLDSLDDIDFGAGWNPETRRWDRPASSGAIERMAAAHTIVALAALELCGPTTAARRVRKAWRRRSDDYAFLIQRLWEKDRDWVGQFVTELAKSARGADALPSGEIIRAVVLHHGLLVPTGEGFRQTWGQGAPVTWRFDTERDRFDPDIDDWWDRDPLLPQLMYLVVGSDHAVGHWIPELLRRGVERSALGRGRLIETLLSGLTSQRRPSAQQVTAESLAALELKTEEIVGGLDYLLGVLATTRSPVMKVLLPHAIRLLRSADDVEQLATLVAGREKLHRQRLLEALTGEELQTGLGDEVRPGLAVLAGDEDLTVSGPAGAALGSLDGDGPTPPATNEPLGLWDLRPTPVAPDVHPRRRLEQVTWATTLLRGYRSHPDDERAATYHVLRDMVSGDRDWRDPLLGRLRELAGGGRLSMERLTEAFRDVFLSGGMASAYPEALALADLCAGLGRRSVGLHLLLRMLAQHAAEIPAEVDLELPANLTTLALSEGKTQAQQEARRLGTALARGDDSQAWLDRGRRRGSEKPASRGLWREPESHPLPADLELTDRRQADATDLDTLARDLTDPTVYPLPTHLRRVAVEEHEHLSARFRTVGAAEDELAVLAIVDAVRAHGPFAVREALRRPDLEEHRYSSLTVDRAALRSWRRDGFSPVDYWRRALRWHVRHEVEDVWRERCGLDRRDRQRPSWPFDTSRDPVELTDLDLPDDDLALLTAPGLPWATPTGHPEVDAPGVLMSLERPSSYAQVFYFRVLESLLNLEHNDVLMSVPTHHDFSLGFDELLNRLRACESRSVGPIDLVLALYRMRPVDPSRASELTGIDVRTTPALTSPAGDESWDVAELVERWLRAGGLPALTATRNDRGRWITHADTPVPLSSCKALAGPLKNNDGREVDMARAVPRWPDVTWSHQGFPAHASGTMGLPLHDHFLEELASAAVRSYGYDPLLHLRCALVHGRIDGELLTRVGVERHRAGTLDLIHVVEATQRLGDEGFLAPLWPLLLGLAGALCAEQKRPTALAALLRQLLGWAAEVPELQLPSGITDLAAGRGATKAHEAARALVSYLEETA